MYFAAVYLCFFCLVSPFGWLPGRSNPSSHPLLLGGVLFYSTKHVQEPEHNYRTGDVFNNHGDYNMDLAAKIIGSPVERFNRVDPAKSTKDDRGEQNLQSEPLFGQITFR
jgi:hypothetical protein